MSAGHRRFERLYGVLGHPLGHSLSPTLHNWGFSLGRLPCVYMSFDKKPEELAGFITTVRTLPLHGVSVTLPHKTAIIPYLDGITPRAQSVGAVNTLYWEDDRLMGDNTDVQGFLYPLQEKHIDKALILGAGGASLAVIAGLMEIGAEVTLAARDPDKALADIDRPNPGRSTVRVIPWESRTEAMNDSLGLVINTTPIGMDGHSPEDTPMLAEAWRRVPPSCTALDVVYNPIQTRFLREAGEAGVQVQDGLDFFVAQGLIQFLLWTGLKLPHGAARICLEQMLKERIHRQKSNRHKAD